MYSEMQFYNHFAHDDEKLVHFLHLFDSRIYYGRISVSYTHLEEIYRGEKYNVMSAATANYLMNGRPSEYDERTWLDILLVKHTLIAAEKMKNEGDTVSGMTDDMSSSSYVRWNENDNA